jgi:hypothetical protein
LEPVEARHQRNLCERRPFHLFRYLDEQGYRYNNRKLTDGERFSIAVKAIVGKRLTFDQLTGKVGETAVF